MLRYASRRLFSAAAATEYTSQASASVSAAKTASASNAAKIETAAKETQENTDVNKSTRRSAKSDSNNNKAEAVPVKPTAENENTKYVCYIPTTPPPGTPARSTATGGISRLKDYQYHFTELLKLFVPQKYFPPTDPRHVALTQMVDAFSMNPTIPMAEKKRSIQLAIDLLRNQKIDLTVQALKDTQQGRDAVKGN